MPDVLSPTVPRAVSPRRLRLLEDVRARSAVEARTVGVCPALLVQATLPHRDPRAAQVVRRSGAFVLTLSSGFAAGPGGTLRPVGVPYGGVGRLLLVHLCTAAARSGDRRVPLGPTFDALLARLGVAATGGRYGRIRYVRDGLTRLAACSLATAWTAPGDGRRSTGGRTVALARRWHLWERSPDLAGQDPREAIDGEGEGPTSGTAGGFVELGRDFYDELVRGGVPVDLRKLALLRASPLAFDLYCWATYAAHGLARSGRSSRTVSWEALHGALGAHYAPTREGLTEFARAARHALAAVRLLWPALDAEPLRGRLTLHATAPDVPREAAPTASPDGSF